MTFLLSSCDRTEMDRTESKSQKEYVTEYYVTGVDDFSQMEQKVFAEVEEIREAFPLAIELSYSGPSQSARVEIRSLRDCDETDAVIRPIIQSLGDGMPSSSWKRISCSLL